MSYNFGNLSHADFEDLVRDLIGRELGVRFEAFGPGPDGGMDGRHSNGAASIVLQAKHYFGSSFPTLKAAMKRERSSIDRLQPGRYVMATSRHLTPGEKTTLAIVIGPSLLDQSDIFGLGDLEGLLRKYPAILRAHIKLWLSEAGVLDRVLRAAAHSFTATTRSELEAKVRVYAENPSFPKSKDKLEANHVVIISGPPGVGKTTLAEMLAYAYIGEGWEFIAIRDLDDGFAAIDDTGRQLFFFDDFLGKVALDTRSLATRDSDLARFLRRVRSAPNARFILTTRAYIFEEARRVSEYLADPKLEVTKYVLDVGVYTRRIRARILYNHLYVARLPVEYIEALRDADAFTKIVDHKNYNPRIIEAMTDSIHLQDVASSDYPMAFLNLLDNPWQIWDIAFRTHISSASRHLLITLFFCSEYGVGIPSLKRAFNVLHPILSRKYSIPFGAKDFEEAVRTLEGGFISITGNNVQFINPSVRDYLAVYLDDVDLLSSCASASIKGDWAWAVWKQAKAVLPNEPVIRKDVAKDFREVARALLHLPVHKQLPGKPYMFTVCDLDNSRRIELLMEWWECTADSEFGDCAISLARAPVEGFDASMDGVSLIELASKLRNGEGMSGPVAEELADLLEDALVKVLRNGMWASELDPIYEAIIDAGDSLDPEILRVANTVVRNEFENASTIADDTNSASTLEEHAEALRSLGSRAGIPEDEVESAISTIEERIEALKERRPDAESPSFTGRRTRDSDDFDDVALRNLFQTLI